MLNQQSRPRRLDDWALEIAALTEWVRSGAHEVQGFQRYANDRVSQLREQGIEPDAWRLG